MIKSAGVEDTIKKQNLTLFAPSDAAFARLEGRAVAWMESDAAVLKDIVLYHVVEGKAYFTSGLRLGVTLVTDEKYRDNLKVIEDRAGNVFLNNAKVSTHDLGVQNGVIHEIDEVLLPIRIMLQMEAEGFTVVG